MPLINRVARRGRRSALARARVFIVVAALLDVGLTEVKFGYFWTGRGTQVAAAATWALIFLALTAFALRKPWGVATVLYAALCIVPPSIGVASGSAMDYAAVTVDLIAGSLFVAAFVIGRLKRDKLPDVWRWDDWSSDGRKAVATRQRLSFRDTVHAATKSVLPSSQTDPTGTAPVVLFPLFVIWWWFAGVPEKIIGGVWASDERPKEWVPSVEWDD